MFRPFVKLTIVAFAAALVMNAGCSKKSAEEDDLSGGQGDSEFSDGSGADGEGAGAGSEPERVRELGSIYFDYDSSSIRGDAKTTLKALASFNPAIKPETVKLGDTYTNEFVKKALAKYGKKK